MVLDNYIIGGWYFIIGACVGSFLNVVCWRLPQMMQAGWRRQCHELLGATSAQTLTDQPEPPTLIKPRSFCPHCKTRIKLRHNLPLAGYCLLGGRCAACKQKISLRYPLVELLTALMTVHAGLYFGNGPGFGPGFGMTSESVMVLLLIWSLILLACIDLEQQLLPDSITLPLLWLGLIFNLDNGFTTLQAAVIGAIAGYLTLWLIYHSHRLISGKEGMGYGDFKLLAALGAWFGWQLLPLLLLLAAGVGTILAVIQLLNKRMTRTTPIPFGPYLALAGWICLFWGQALLDRYLPGFRI